MLNISYSVAPVFSLIILGYIIRRKFIGETVFWETGDKLVYWLLLPSLLFYQLSSNELPAGVIAEYAVIILGGFAVVIVLSMLGSKLLGFAGPVVTSVMQGSARHNSFAALAIAGKLFGDEGLVLATLIMAILIPVTNIVVVTLIVTELDSSNGKKAASRAIIKGLLTNPIFLAIIVGLIASVYNIKQMPIIHDTAKLLGQAALPLLLLLIGGNLMMREIKSDLAPIILASVVKMLVFPLAIFALAQFFTLSRTELIVALLFGLVPTAASSYSLAKHMGGDARLMGAIISIQTAVSFISIPLLLSWLG